MKYLFVLLASFLLQGRTPTQDCVPPLTKEYLDQNNVIAIVSITDDLNNPKVIKVFKGSLDIYCFLGTSDDSFSFDRSGQYLIYSARSSSDGHPIVEKCSRSKRIEDAQMDLDYLSTNISCFNPSLKGNGACTREYVDVICGCDGITYHNRCEMQRRKGVAVYSYPPCE